MYLDTCIPPELKKKEKKRGGKGIQTIKPGKDYILSLNCM